MADPLRESAPGRARRGKPDWTAPLFRPPGEALLADLDKALAAAARAFAVPASRRADLPFAVRDLSRLLTEDKGGLSQSYWAVPRFVAAYLRYFLPWNLLRLSWLLPGLDLPLEQGAQILDLGSGPLTLPLALWLSRPDLRDKTLDIVCTDVSPKIMERGRDIFQILTGPDSPWRISLIRGTADAVLRARAGGNIQAVLAGNMLNERLRQHDAKGGERRRGIDSLVAGIAACLAPDGRALLLEPGTRLGGLLVSQCRQAALELGLAPLAPCTHAGPCPLCQGSGPEAGAGARERSTAWCHFLLSAKNAPASLSALSAKANLEKERMALSFLLLAPASGEEQKKPAASAAMADELDELEALYQELMAQETGGAPGGLGQAPLQESKDEDQDRPARVVSGPIALPGRTQAARYICSSMGLGLLLDAEHLPSGAGVTARAEAGRRDSKSGALIMRSIFKAEQPPRQDANGRKGHLKKPRKR